jgi:hypothetical protein
MQIHSLLHGVYCAIVQIWLERGSQNSGSDPDFLVSLKEKIYKKYKFLTGSCQNIKSPFSVHFLLVENRLGRKR